MDKDKKKPGRPAGSKNKVSLRLVQGTGSKVRVRARPVQSDTSNPGTEQPMAATPVGRKTRVRTPKSPVTGMTDKQEHFVQCLMAGQNMSDAYRTAYVTENMSPSSIHRKALELYQNGAVSARISAINAEAEANRRMLAVSDVALALSVLRDMAVRADTDASKIRAAELLAKVGGLFVEQVDFKDKTDRSEDEIAAAIQQRLARLGLAS